MAVVILVQDLYILRFCIIKTTATQFGRFPVLMGHDECLHPERIKKTQTLMASMLHANLRVQESDKYDFECIRLARMSSLD